MTFESEVYEDAEPEDRRWIWPNRIPMNKVTLVAGDSGAGKSRVIAKALITWMHLEDFPDDEFSNEEPGEVLVVTTEVDAKEFWDMFITQGAEPKDLHKITRLKHLRDDNGNVVPFDLDKHKRYLEDQLKIYRPKVLILDPLIEFHSRREIDSSQIRGLMLMLDNLCEKYSVAIVGMIHWNKNEKQSNGNRVSGSHQYKASVRSMITVYRDPKNPKMRTLHQEKMSLGPESRDLGFEVNIVKGEVLWAELPIPKFTQGKEEEAQVWLLEHLTSPMTVKECLAASGIMLRTLQRARGKLEGKIVTTYKFKNGSRVPHWELASQSNNYGNDLSTDAPGTIPPFEEEG